MKSCLIVDDSGVIRKLIRQTLEEFGFTCREAADGGMAATACEVEMPELVMLDWNMPNVSGIEFLTILRKMAGGDKPVVVFCTTENDMEHISKALAEGANDFIMKPFDKEILRSKLEQNNLLDKVEVC